VGVGVWGRYPVVWHKREGGGVIDVIGTQNFKG